MAKAKVDLKAIIDRGFVTNGKEYTALQKQQGLEKLSLRTEDGFTEGIWIAPLEPSDHAVKRFRFVFYNDPLQFMNAPRPTAGLVGIATSNGPNMRATAHGPECWSMFKKVSKASIAAYNADLKASKKKSKGKKVKKK